MLEIITKRDNPNAASQAANTRRIMGAMLANVKWLLIIVIDIMTKRDSIIPSKHSREDIRCDRYMSRPIRDRVKAREIFTYTMDT